MPVQHNKALLSGRAGALVACLLPLQAAWATQGTFPHGYGVKSEGMGGVVIALPQDSLVGASNPAGMVAVGDRLDVGAAFLKADNGAEFAGNTISGSKDRDLYVIPQFGANKMLDDVSSLGISVVGNGVGTAYARDADFGGLRNPGSQFQQMVATASYARKLNERHSVGVGLMLLRQVLDIDGTASIGLPQGRDESYGAGLRLGWIGQLTSEWSLGASYATRGYMSKMHRFDKLLADGGDLDMPSNWALGVAWKHGPLTLAADMQKVYWSDVRSLGNPGVSRATGAPGDSDGPGFGWRDQRIWRVGAAWDLNERLTLRAGYNDANQLLDGHDTYLGILAPAANHRHVTFGGTYRFTGGHELSLAYARSFKDKVEGEGAGPDAVTSPYMGQHWLSLSYGVAF
ncbi:OmpP1/FadL family transporter [Pseudomonas citronellolis]|uniref:OmpP1/FadL family transporter n=1 Tax=Pseudomonas citronellolis TaxID=53408 RepID=UPI0020A05B0B|nr:outer membrane protein transport protein [Pseudomonas citronellolis]MCP1604135.1 long-chain fatty acid transport protein [Pseudomonas citronellolis]MCP1657553.1 long-chain fatty acid transport protein [Pseudomonas citronellolis]MCP1721777.1 long-chain fatty acid transport protein [Pseudomonas citronellolis]